MGYSPQSHKESDVTERLSTRCTKARKGGDGALEVRDPRRQCGTSPPFPSLLLRGHGQPRRREDILSWAFGLLNPQAETA